MILCPNCLHKEMGGAIFCNECGSQLVFNAGVPTSNIDTTAAPGSPFDPQANTETQIFIASYLNTQLSLNLIDSGEVLNLGERSDITLGRMSEGQPIIPDIDLSPYKAYEAGISRMHAAIKIREQVTITDLGSANGTRVNGQKIPAHTPFPIRHGDTIVLGKFKIQILFQKKQ